MSSSREHMIRERQIETQQLLKTIGQQIADAERELLGTTCELRVSAIVDRLAHLKTAKRNLQLVLDDYERENESHHCNGR